MLLLIISLSYMFLILLDHNKSKDVLKSTVFISVLITLIGLMAFAVMVLQFELLYLVVIFPVVLILSLLIKNRKLKQLYY